MEAARASCKSLLCCDKYQGKSMALNHEVTSLHSLPPQCVPAEKEDCKPFARCLHVHPFKSSSGVLMPDKCLLRSAGEGIQTTAICVSDNCTPAVLHTVHHSPVNRAKVSAQLQADVTVWGWACSFGPLE